ncbi:MAG: hypothetical protein REH83_04690 [Rickettsiella sp.]|nr:hypothetical protein [Rickettsiella sp.]
MKLKQALVLGLTTAVLAIPAFAADEATNATSLTPSATEQKDSVTPAKKEAIHKKGYKKNLNNESAAAKKDQTDLSAVNPNVAAEG